MRLAGKAHVLSTSCVPSLRSGNNAPKLNEVAHINHATLVSHLLSCVRFPALSETRHISKTLKTKNAYHYFLSPEKFLCVFIQIAYSLSVG